MRLGDARNTVRFRRRQRGIGFLFCLYAIAALGLLAAGTGRVWYTSQQRERETELLFVGNQYAMALASYRAIDVNGQHQLPRTLEELLEDRRGPRMVRHLRQLYRDPMTNLNDWVLLKNGDRIGALHSRSHGTAFKQVFDPPNDSFSGHATYDEWVFTPPAEGSTL